MALSLLTRWYKNIVPLIFLLFVKINAVHAQPQPIEHKDPYYSLQEIIDSGHTFFGRTAGGIAVAIENIFSQYGYPNAYILGEEASGA
ncbi:EipA family protein, partial [Bartonella sp. MR168JLCBS]